MTRVGVSGKRIASTYALDGVYRCRKADGRRAKVITAKRGKRLERHVPQRTSHESQESNHSAQFSCHFDEQCKLGVKNEFFMWAVRSADGLERIFLWLTNVRGIKEG
jgi:hypothetical protein